MLSSLDNFVIGLYLVLLVSAAYYVSSKKTSAEMSSEDYFLAGKSLPWWAIGASLIAANISAEQIIGQSGQGFVLGLAIAAYEWQAAIVLIIVAKFMLPIFLKNKIYTMPQFLEQRFGSEIKVLMAVFWLILYTAVNLTAILWLGALAITTLTGVSINIGLVSLAVLAIVYSIYGGLRAVAFTDIIQVVVLILGGIIITFIALSQVGGDGGVTGGLTTLMSEAPGHFRMIFSQDSPHYQALPGIWTLLGGLWVLHFSYWGFNQYIIQRALAAESVQEAQKGLVFAAGLKLLIPLIVVIPGIAAMWLAQNGVLDNDALSAKPDSTYGVLIGLVPEGVRGVVFAALIAAILSSLASMVNSISTIFTMDMYRGYVKKEAEESHYVFVGRVCSVVAMTIAVFLAKPFVGNMESAFQLIQEYTGFVAPGIVSVFLLGMFWPKCTKQAAFAMLLISVVANIAMKLAYPDVAFVIRIWGVFLACLAAGYLVSVFKEDAEQAAIADLSGVSFKTSTGFNHASLVITGILVLIYVIFW
ncbi:MAG: sodium:solute symporter family transporter [Parvibaculales bacterium]